MAKKEYQIFKTPLKDSNGQPLLDRKKVPRYRFSMRWTSEDEVTRYGTPKVKTKALKAETSEDAAVEADTIWKEGAGRLGKDPLVFDFLLDHWRLDSTYAKEKKRIGKPLSRGYIEITRMVIKKHLEGPLKGLRLSKVSIPKVRLILHALEASGCTSGTVNDCLCAIRVPITAWARDRQIPDPLAGLKRSAENRRERGVLSIEELAKIVSLENIDPRAKCSTLLGVLCGLRLGEVRGLQLVDIEEENGLLHVRHNWVNNEEGLKKPKCNSIRDVPLPPIVLEALKQVQLISHKKTVFALWNEINPSKPIDAGTITRGFHKILEQIGISKENQKTRNLVFHGLRHSYITLSRLVGLPDFIVMRLAGHKSLNMTENYSHVENVIDYAKARISLNNAVTKSGEELTLEKENISI